MTNLNDEFNHMVMKGLSNEFLLFLKNPFVSKSYKKKQSQNSSGNQLRNVLGKNHSHGNLHFLKGYL